ncbi:MAG: hypothetical protein BRC53_00720 [Cyanobacteria bacterium SW_6_48_11]|nr:MAG: hypothetical protein BRC48_00230 [Cyanobacteria bacterium QS_9_48_30]PSP00355.1 MAG: hypothetical protein BRC53_00720 [Cyanobacteria bacterium SW_6_48_11]
MDKKVVIEYDDINTKEEIDRVEQNLKAINGVKVHIIGINTAELSYDENNVDGGDIERAIEDVGGNVRTVNREE